MRYETREYRRPIRQAFPGGVRVTLTSGETFESDFPYQKGGPENPLSAGGGAGEVPRQRRARARRTRDSTALEEAILALERARRSDRRARPADAAAAVARVRARLALTDRAGGDRRAVRAFVDKDVIPVASELEHADEFPTALVETMREMGLFGTTIPEEYGGLGLGLDTYALIQMELSRGWVTLPGS